MFCLIEIPFIADKVPYLKLTLLPVVTVVALPKLSKLLVRCEYMKYLVHCVYMQRQHSLQWIWIETQTENQHNK